MHTNTHTHTHACKQAYMHACRVRDVTYTSLTYTESPTLTSIPQIG